MVLQERTGDFLGNGAAFCLYGLGLMGIFIAGLSLTRLGVEGEKRLEVTIGDSSEEEMWIGDIVAEVLVILREERKNLFGSVALFYSSNFGLVEGL